MSFVVPFLKMSEVVKHIAHYEFVEEDDAEKSGPSNEDSKYFLVVALSWTCLFFLNGRYKDVCFC